MAAIQDARDSMKQLRDAWLAATNPDAKRALVQAMASLSKSSATPNTINGSLGYEDTLNWLQQRGATDNQLLALTSAEDQQGYDNELAKTSIKQNAIKSKDRAAWGAAGRGIANSSIRDTALTDIDASVNDSTNTIDARLNFVKGQNDVTRLQLLGQWDMFDLAYDPQRMKNARILSDAEGTGNSNPATGTPWTYDEIMAAFGEQKVKDDAYAKIDPATGLPQGIKDKYAEKMKGFTLPTYKPKPIDRVTTVTGKNHLGGATPPSGKPKPKPLASKAFSKPLPAAAVKNIAAKNGKK